MVTFAERKRVESEAQVQKALTAYLNKECLSLRKAANALKIAYTTLHRRMAGGTSRSSAHETQQTLPNAEETSLTR